MAEERIVTNIVANADFSNLIADVHKVTASLSKLQEQMANSNKMFANNIAVMNRSFSETLRSTGQFSTHFVSLASDVEKFGKNLDGGKLKLRQYYDAFQQHARTSTGLIKDLAKQQVALQNAILQPLGRNAQGLMQFNVQVPRGLDETRNKAALARQELQIMNKVIQEGANQLINWGKNTQWAGRQLTVGLTVPMAAFGKAAADAFRQADQELVRLTKVYGGITSPTQKQLTSIRKDVAQTANDLAKAYGTGYTETIALAADIAATGKEGNDLLKATKETTRLAVLGEVDKQTAMKATLSIQTAFKQNTDQLSESINFLNAVENQTSTTLQDLIEAIPKAGPVIQGLGGSVKDLALYLTAMKEGGINATEGANALKSALASLINPTKTATDMFAGFGIDLRGIVTKDAGNLTQTLLDLQSALDQLNPLQKQQALEQLFGKFQFARMNALFENLGRQGSQTLKVLDLMKSSSQDLANIAGRELAQVTESASGRYRRAMEGLKADLAGVGEQFLNINTSLINIIDKVIKFADKLPKPVKQLLAVLGGITAVAGPFIMLTGVLANFFGYIVKGISHMRSFFRGGEGWKYLTPEMLAAEKAGSMVEKTFYSDAKAASILQLALKNLIDEFSVLEAKAASGAISVGPAIQTMAGNFVTPGVGPRVVDPRHPLVGDPYSRASTHMVPRSGMTEAERMQQTMFGFVPGSIPVNRKIGNNPQIYMNEGLPNVPGLTTIHGTSTGVVAGEAAKWHAMQAALGMQSKGELESLKKELATTGLLGKDFIATYETILPTITTFVDNAARDSAAIIGELRAGKINVEQARAQIIALNLQVEQDIAAASIAAAEGMGRTLNPTVVPTLNQPVVDPTGKSNMRELFKKGKTRGFINKVAGALGVRTSGAGYNIETTIPKKYALGGPVYLDKGGGPKGTDTVPAWLTPGEYVLPKNAVDRIGLDTLEAARAGATLQIASDSPIVGAHASVPRTMAGYEIMGSPLGQFAPDSVKAFAQHYPDEKFDIKDAQRLGLFREENDALREGKMGLTKNDLMRALSAPESQLFKYMPELNSKERKLLREHMIARVADLSGDRRYHDSTLARIFGYAKVDTYKMLPQEEQVSFRKKFFDLQKPKYIQQHSLSKLVSPEAQKMSTAEAKSAAGSDPFSFKQTSGKSTKDAIVLGADNKKYVYTSGATRQFKAAIRTTPGIGALRPGVRDVGGKFLPRVIPAFEQVVMRNRWKKGYSSGGVVPGYYGMGGLVGGMLMGTGIGIGGQMLGNAIGGGLGSAITMGSGLLGSMVGFGSIGQKPEGQQGFIGTQLAKLPAGLKEPVGPMNNLAKASKGLSGELTGMSRVFGPLLRGFAGALKLTSPLGLAITGTTVAVGVAIKYWKDHQEALRLNRLGYGMTADAAQKAGLKYTDYNAKIKEAIDNAKALKERNKMIYESTTQSGTPLKMTIEQYKQLKETVKSTMGDYVKLINQTNSGEVGDVAIRLKAQFMAAGDSAEQATAKIYTLISQSNKAALAASSIGSKDFQGIQTPQDVVKQSTKTFEAAANLGDAKAQADALLSSFQAIDSAVSNIVTESEKQAKQGKINKDQTITTGQAVKQQLDTINNGYSKQTKLTKDVISEIYKMDPELAKVLNTSDTLTSAWTKYQLIVQGINIDVRRLSDFGAQAAVQLSQIISSQVGANPTIKAQTTAYKNLQTQIDNVTKAAKGQSVQQQISSRDAISALQKQIDLIKKAAQDKIDGIRKQADAENTQLEIQKKQLEAQQALARGDMGAYTQSQLDVQQLSNTAQQKAAEEAISKKAELDIKPLQDKIDALNNKNQALADKAALAGDSLSTLNKKAGDLNSSLSTYTQNIQNVLFKLQTEGDKFKLTDEYKNAIAAIGDAGKKLGISVKPEDIVSQIQKSLANGINANEVKLYTKELQSDKAYSSKQVAITKSDVRSDESKLSFKDMQDIIKKYKLQKGDTFTTPEGFNYEVTRGYDAKGFNFRGDAAKRMALGGFIRRAQSGVSGITGSQPYLVGERGPELFIPSAGGQIIPSNMLRINEPSYNIPNNSISGIRGGVNSSYNNNVYNIDIALNGTNVTADDVVRKFKAELALVNAKEGKSRYVGGSV